MRPKTIDDVVLAYEMSVRDLHVLEDALRAAAKAVTDAQEKVSAQLKLVSQLRGDVERYTKEAA